jgi:threonine/homoserine/homoserine lactone efflux protein
MPPADTLLAFAAASLLLLLLPGPAVMYIVTRSATQGVRAGLVSVAGIHLGTVVHIVAAMAGLSAVLATSATAFSIVKLAGAAYLLWLGLRSFRSYRHASRPKAERVADHRPLGKIFADGIVLNILNPKTAIFFLSFAPQFVDPNATNPTATLAVLGGVFIGTGMVTDGAYALAGTWIGGRLSSSATFPRRKDLTAGFVYTGLGLVTALAGGRDD